MRYLFVLLFVLFASTAFACDAYNRYDHHNSDLQAEQYYNSVTGKQTPTQGVYGQPQQYQLSSRQCYDTCMDSIECRKCARIKAAEINAGVGRYGNGAVQNSANILDTTKDFTEKGVDLMYNINRANNYIKILENAF